MTANTVINSENETMETMGTDQVTLLFGAMYFYLFLDLACGLCVRISIAKIAGLLLHLNSVEEGRMTYYYNPYTSYTPYLS
jgi:hypothetical protein